MSARRRPDLQGSLSVIAPELVLQILSLARANGHLALRCAGREGHVDFRSGQVVAVWIGRKRKPVPATQAAALRQPFATLLGWREGTFRFLQDGESLGSGPGFDVEGLLLDAMTQLDRARGGAGEDPGH